MGGREGDEVIWNDWEEGVVTLNGVVTEELSEEGTPMLSETL